MAKNTDIQWCDSTTNPTLGCDGCELHRPGYSTCYAAAMTRRFGGKNPGLATDFNVVELAPGRMETAAAWSDLRGASRPDKPWLDGLPRLIFVSDMADALSSDVPFEYLRDEIVETVHSVKGRRHQWLWLTKRPTRMAKFSVWLSCQGIDWPANLWVGTSVTSTGTRARIDDLLRVGNAQTIRFVSVEPQWTAIDLRPWLPQLDWVIQGGQSGRGDHPFSVEWAKDMRRQCRDCGVPFFLKQLGSHLSNEGERTVLIDRHGGDWSEWPTRLRVREMPIYVGRRRQRHIRQHKVQPSCRSTAARANKNIIPNRRCRDHRKANDA